MGAGIFRVTSDASALTGPSVIVGHLVLAALIFATAVPYMVFLSTSLGEEPGGEYGHVRATFGSDRVAFLGAWLKLISYVGAGTYLAVALADYGLALLGLLGADLDPVALRAPLAAAALLAFWWVHVSGVRWFGRVQVSLCAVLGVSIAVLVLPGLFAIEPENYRPFFTGGAGGFAAALPPLFFSWAGFESLAHSGGEVRDSRRALPRTFARGIALTLLVFLSMSVVAFGVLPASELEASDTPMAAVAAAYLPAGGTAFVAVGGVAAVATSLNATMYVPARLAGLLAEHGNLPRWVGAVHAGTRTPVIGVTLTLVMALLLLVSGRLELALGIAVFSLLAQYLLHSLALLFLPRANPALWAEASRRIPRSVQVAAAVVSIAGVGALLCVQVLESVRAMGEAPFGERLAGLRLTTVELFALWGLLGCVVYAGRGRWSRGRG